jgi:single-stranded DNA-binding protein
MEHKLAITLSPVVHKVSFLILYVVRWLMTDKTSWFRITSFNPSDYVRERVKKGALVFVDGDVSLDKYQDEASGKTLTSIRIVQSTFLLFSCVASC